MAADDQPAHQFLARHAPTYLDFEYRKYEKGLLRADGGLGFQTQTGRIELWLTYFNQVGMEPVPNYEEPTPGPVADPDLYEEYPLILTTGARNWTLFHSEHRQVPRLRAYRPDPILQIHPEAAAKYGVAEGDWVWVENHRGRAKRKVQLCEGLRKPQPASNVRDNGDGGCCHAEHATVLNLDTLSVTTPSSPLSRLRREYKEKTLCHMECWSITSGARGATAARSRARRSCRMRTSRKAHDVINGVFGNGDARKAALGGKYDAVQARVNEILNGGSSSSGSGVDVDDLARRVIAGEFGNGQARRDALGGNYEAVQARVNEMLG